MLLHLSHGKTSDGLSDRISAICSTCKKDPILRDYNLNSGVISCNKEIKDLDTIPDSSLSFRQQST